MFPECCACPQGQYLGPPPWPNPRRSVGVEVVETLPPLRPGLPLSCPFGSPGEKLPPVSIGRPSGWVGMLSGCLKHPTDPGLADLAPGSRPCHFSSQLWAKWASDGAGGAKRKKTKGMRGPQPSGSLNVSTTEERLKRHKGSRTVRGGSILPFQAVGSWGFCEPGLCPGWWQDRPSKSDEPKRSWIHMDSKNPRTHHSSTKAGGWLVMLGNRWQWGEREKWFDSC